MGSLEQSANMKTSFIFFTCLFAFLVAQRKEMPPHGKDVKGPGYCLAIPDKKGGCVTRANNCNKPGGYNAKTTGAPPDDCCCKCCNSNGNCGITRCGEGNLPLDFGHF